MLYLQIMPYKYLRFFMTSSFFIFFFNVHLFWHELIRCVIFMAHTNRWDCYVCDKLLTKIRDYYFYETQEIVSVGDSQ